MSRLSSATNILMEHPYLVAPDLDNAELSLPEQHKQLVDASGKLLFLKQLLPRLKERGHRVLLFSQFKISLDLIEDFLRGEGYKYLRLDGDVNQLHRQKDMDKFNAPGSDYFIFLLTTRAGGVGVNLASADTVIIHDPDFNPHQDLQAISRAHRYGQNKRVLVFKLMMENSAEVRIINSGKRKLVLDHLVVQQLGKEREEGDNENLILYGAEDIAKIDEDASDMRIWTPKMIDDLIDDAEKEADEMVKAQKDVDEAKLGASQAEEEDASKKRGFSFAKIWETKAKEVAKEALDGDGASPEPEPDFDEHGWVQFLEQAEATEAAQREAARAVAGRLRALKKNVKYTTDRDDVDRKKKNRSKGKELSQATVEERDSDDDVDFIPGPDFDMVSEEEDEEGEAPSDLEDLSYDQRVVIGGMAAGQRKLTKHERALLRKWSSRNEKKRAEALERASASNLAVQQADAAHPPQPQQAEAGPGPTTLQLEGQEASVRYALVTAANAAEAIARVASEQALHVSVAPQQRPPPEPVRWPVVRMMAEPQHSENIRVGRTILRQLFIILQQTQDIGHLTDWGNMARDSTSTAVRKSIYVRLSTVADEKRRHEGGLGQQFLANRTIAAVVYFIDSGAPIHPLQYEASAVRPLPFEAAPIGQAQAQPLPLQPGGQQSYRWSGPSVAMQQPQQQPPPHPQPHAPLMGYAPPQRSYQQAITPDYRQANQSMAQPMFRLMPQTMPQATPQPPPPLLAHHELPVDRTPPPPSRTIPQNHVNAPIASTSQSHSKPLSASALQSQSCTTTRTPQLPIMPQAGNAGLQIQTLVPQINGTGPNTPASSSSRATGGRASTVISLSNGPAKDTGAHPVETPNAMQLGDSSRFDPQSHRRNRSESGEEKCYWCQQNHRLRYCPGLLSESDIKLYKENIAKSNDSEDAKANGLKALAMMEAAHKERAEIERQEKLKRPRRSTAGGTAGDPIEIEVLDSAPQSRPPSAASNKRPRNGTSFQGCCVCMDPQVHPLASCPVVRAGPESIAGALQAFEPNTPTHDILSTFLRSAEMGVPPGAMEPCAYCNTLCGVSVRQCAELRGKRKDLKRRIRQIDERVLPSNEEKVRVLKSRRAMTAVWELESLDRQIADAQKEVVRLEGVLARLYEAYNQWPNPKRASLTERAGA